MSAKPQRGDRGPLLAPPRRPLRFPASHPGDHPREGLRAGAGGDPVHKFPSSAPSSSCESSTALGLDCLRKELAGPAAVPRGCPGDPHSKSSLALNPQGDPLQKDLRLGKPGGRVPALGRAPSAVRTARCGGVVVVAGSGPGSAQTEQVGGDTRPPPVSFGWRVWGGF